MNRKTVSGIMLTLLLLGMLMLAFNIQLIQAAPRTWCVDDDGGADFSSIQQAINSASPGDTVFVHSGTYYEHVRVNKSLSLIGENRSTTVIDGYTFGTVVQVTADDVLINEFTIQNGWWGVYLCGTQNCSIAENVIRNNEYRYIGSPPDFELIIVPPGRGIWLYESKNNRIIENTLNNNHRGISLEYSNSNSVVGNVVLSSTLSWGIFLEVSHDNTICNNLVKHSTYDGIYLVVSEKNNIIRNSVMNNGDEGIYLGMANNNVIIGNNVKNNPGDGIMLDGSDGNTVVENTVTNNGKRGIALWMAKDNTIYHNNFIDNAWGQACSSQINLWDDSYPSGGNYWSDYTGVDEKSGVNQDQPGSDGIGDTPYTIYLNNQDRYPLVESWSIPTMINNLIRTIRFWNLPKGTENSLTSKLNDAIHLFDAGNENGAVHKLMDIIDQVETLREKKLTDEQADYLAAEAQRIKDLIQR